METSNIIEIASKHLETLKGHEFDILEVSKPISPESALNLSKVISKLSPMLGNLIEFNTVEFLNMQKEFDGIGTWERQDPGFPDAVFRGISPTPGFEIKAWFPLATEITARFKDSQNHFAHDNTYVAMLAWLPEYLIFGKPKILDVCIVPGKTVAESRDNHYHNPPHYIVREPEDTASRTSNLQQTNTNGYIFQGSTDAFANALSFVSSWGEGGKKYSPDREYQLKLQELQGRFTYRLDTNYAKMDRIRHSGIEQFKARVQNTIVHGKTVRDWTTLLNRGTPEVVKEALAERFNITEGTVKDLLD